MALLPEMILISAAAVSFLLGTSKSRTARQAAPILTLLALAAALVSQLGHVVDAHGVADPWQTVQVSQFARYVKLLTAGMGILLTLLAWPTNQDSTAGAAIHFGSECGEFFGLLLLSVSGLFLVAGANDMMTLFLGIELASLPTYIMVSISRPLAVAQEAGVILTDGMGQPLDGPLDVTTGISWAAFANPALRQAIEPILTGYLAKKLAGS